jgi:hypothetical protein|tara:strand:+ start:197 stop:964 length:768 start_codon:yes stop_codon:yes gene_type:complete
MKITFRQSWISTFLRCPEQARQEREGLVKQKETSDLLRGNAVHYAIEMAGTSPIVKVNPPQLLDWVDEYIAENAHTVEEWRHSYEKIVDVCRANILVWHDEVWPQLGVPRAVERTFKKKIGKRKGVELWLSGTADWEDESGEIWDWKNPSRFYEPWEKRRWDIQSHAYCWALGAEKFNLAVFANGQYQHIPIERNEADHKAFIDLCWSIVPLITADIKPWPMNWTGWHCSPKWCPVWQDGKCRGKHLGQGKPESW